MNAIHAPNRFGLLDGQRVLVIDDIDESRMLLVGFLQQQGCRVYVGKNGQDGVAKAQLIKPDLILMDIRMPVLDGITACRMLKADPATRHIPLIFLTAAAAPEERVTGLLAGAVDYVTKPFDFEEIRLRLCIHLKANAREREEPAPAPPDTPLAAAATAASRLDIVLFQTARAKLLENLAHAPSLAELAAAIGTYPRRLNTAFKQCAGVTVFDFLREERMKKAMELLAETDLEVQFISSQLGFGSAPNFSTAFRDRFGMSPRQFRSTSGRTT